MASQVRKNTTRNMLNEQQTCFLTRTLTGAVLKVKLTPLLHTSAALLVIGRRTRQLTTRSITTLLHRYRSDKCESKVPLVHQGAVRGILRLFVIRGFLSLCCCCFLLRPRPDLGAPGRTGCLRSCARGLVILLVGTPGLSFCRRRCRRDAPCIVTVPVVPGPLLTSPAFGAAFLRPASPAPAA